MDPALGGTALVYFWGLTLTVQGILTPSLSELFPDPRYFMFWGMHFFTVWAAVYLTFGLGVRPSWRSYRFTVAVTAVWAVMVMVFNALAGTNYGYLNRKPAVGTLLDLFGPWPGYVVARDRPGRRRLGTDDLAVHPVRASARPSHRLASGGHVGRAAGSRPRLHGLPIPRSVTGTPGSRRSAPRGPARGRSRRR